MNTLYDKANRRPILDPVLLALKSRRVVIAVMTLLVGLLVMAVPELAAVQTEVLTLLITLALALIGGYSIEDAAIAARQREPIPADDTLREQVREVVESLLDELT